MVEKLFLLQDELKQLKLEGANVDNALDITNEIISNCKIKNMDD